MSISFEPTENAHLFQNGRVPLELVKTTEQVQLCILDNLVHIMLGMQGMRCPVNSHKPSFHVNTSVTMKSSNGKRSSSGQRGPSVEETMTEEEFVEWLQNAVQSGTFGDFDGSTPQRSAGTSTSNSASGSKRKKKGKKQW